MCIYIYTLHGSRGAGRSFFGRFTYLFCTATLGDRKLGLPMMHQIWMSIMRPSPKLEVWGFSDCQTLFCNVMTFTEPYFAQFFHSFWNGRKPLSIAGQRGNAQNLTDFTEHHKMYLQSDMTTEIRIMVECEATWNDLWYNTSLRMKRWGNPQPTAIFNKSWGNMSLQTL